MRIELDASQKCIEFLENFAISIYICLFSKFLSEEPISIIVDYVFYK